jgi:hypothetical protein
MWQKVCQLLQPDVITHLKKVLKRKSTPDKQIRKKTL